MLGIIIIFAGLIWAAIKYYPMKRDNIMPKVSDFKYQIGIAVFGIIVQILSAYY